MVGSAPGLGRKREPGPQEPQAPPIQDLRDRCHRQQWILREDAEGSARESCVPGRWGRGEGQARRQVSTVGNLAVNTCAADTGYGDRAEAQGVVLVADPRLEVEARRDSPPVRPKTENRLDVPCRGSP